MNSIDYPTFSKYIAQKTAKINNPNSLSPHNYYEMLTPSDESSNKFTYRHGNPYVNNNCKLINKHSTPINCRYFSYAWLCTRPSDANSANWRLMFSSAKRIVAQALLWENTIDKHKILYKANAYYDYNPNKGFGTSLYEVVKNIRLDETKSMLFHLETHTMAIKVKYKKATATKPARYVLVFYDPNHTQSSIRVVFENLDKLKKLNILDLLPSYHIKLYSPKFKGGVFALYDNPDNLANMPTMIIQSSFNIDMDVNRLEEQLHNALEFNNLELMDKIFNHILRVNIGSDKHKKQLFLAANCDGTPGLWLALQMGQTEGVSRYIKFLLERSQLPLGYMCELLMVKSPDNIYGLCVAFEHLNLETICEYCRLILSDTKLDESSKVKVLGVLGLKNKEGRSVLDIGLASGHYEVVITYVDIVLQSKLSLKSKIKLLNLEYLQTKLSMLMPWQRGAYEICINSIKIILSKALHVGDYQVLDFYIDNLLNSVLSNGVRLDVLQSKDKDGLSGLYRALKGNHPEAVHLYLIKLLGSTLTDLSKIKILLAKDKDGRTGLEIALHHNNAAAVMAYVKAVLTSTLSDDVKAELLSIQDTCTTDYPVATTGSPKAIDIYKTLITRSTLRDDLKAQLIANVA